jgi:hypothetical protein
VPGALTNEYGLPSISSFDPGGAGSARRPNCPATNVTSGASTCSECRRSVHRTLPVDPLPFTHLRSHEPVACMGAGKI